jgi:hypothetical protein
MVSHPMALIRNYHSSCPSDFSEYSPQSGHQVATGKISDPENLAGDESRTRDLQLGKLSLYRLSYTRVPTSLANKGIKIEVQQSAATAERRVGSCGGGDAGAFGAPIKTLTPLHRFF